MLLDTEAPAEKARRIADLVGGVRPAARLCGVTPTQYFRWRSGAVHMRPDSQRLIDNTLRLVQLVAAEIGDDAGLLASVLQRPSESLGYRSCQDFVRERRFDELFTLLGSYVRQGPIRTIRDVDVVAVMDRVDSAITEVSDAEWLGAWAQGENDARAAPEKDPGDEPLYDLPPYVTLRSPSARTNTMARRARAS